jgi:hypothetical protein
MPKFIVTVIKTETYSTDIEIEAPTLAQAESMAEDDAREELLNWKYAETDWESFGEQINEEGK